MRRLLLLGFVFAGIGLAQNPGTPQAAAWPGHVATWSDLLQAADHATATLGSSIGTTDLTITLNNTSTLVAYQVLRIDSELMKICSVASASQTITICSGGRGFAGSTAASHAAGASALGIISAVYHNQEAAELVALEADQYGKIGSTSGTAGTPINGASWPNHAVTSAELYKAADMGATPAQLTANAAATDTSLTVNSAANFVADQLIGIDSELMEVCSASGTTITICAGTRGLGGTTAASHSSGAQVIGPVASLYHDRIANEIISLETDLFPTLGGGTASNGASWPNHVATVAELAGVASGATVFAVWHNRIATEIMALESSLSGKVPTGSSHYVALAWNASSGATSYKLYRTTTSGSGYTQIATVSATNYSDASVTSGTTYYYILKASNSAGDSAATSEISAAIP